MIIQIVVISQSLNH